MTGGAVAGRHRRRRVSRHGEQYDGRHRRRRDAPGTGSLPCCGYRLVLSPARPVPASYVDDVTRSQRPLLAAALAIAVVTGLGVVAATGADGQDHSRDGSASRTAAAAKSSPTSSGARAGASAPRGTSPSADSSPGPRTARSGRTHAATPVGEVMAAGRTPSGLPGLARAVARARTPLVGPSLPRAAVAQGALVPNFPEALAPVAASVVRSSSLSPAGRRLQVVLTATTRGGASDVLGSYRNRLTRLGFAELPSRAAGGATSAAFRRGASTVVVTTARLHGGSYSVFASLSAANG